MKKISVSHLFGGFILLLSMTVAAEQTTPNSGSAKHGAEEVVAELRKMIPNIAITGTQATDVKDLVEIQLGDGTSLYAVKGTQYFVRGDLYRVGGGELVSITEERQKDVRRQRMASVDKKDMIVFSPKGPAKGHINVFTDSDCGYCQKLHREVPELNAMGIEVRYLAFPRGGKGSNAYTELVSAWCAKDKLNAMNQIKAGQPIATNVCQDNPVEQQFRMGNEIGVNATPAIVLEDGSIIMGYRPAGELARALGIEVTSAR